MLHIILLIVKIIGMILAAVLGLVLLVIGLVLFVPVRYRLQAGCLGDFQTLQVRGRVTWLLRLARADVSLRDRKLKWRIRAAWKKQSGGRQFAGKAGRTGPAEDTAPDPAMAEEGYGIRPDPAIEEKEGRYEKKETVDPGLKKAQTAEWVPEGHGEDPPVSGNPDPADEKKDVGPGDRGFQKKTGDRAKRDQSGQGLFGKLAAFAEKIKCTIDKICARIKALAEKKDQVVSIIEDEAHVAAVKKGKSELFRLARILKPGQCRVSVVFGFESPQHTGQALAALAVLYPFLGEGFSVTPDFERSVFTGTLDIGGHIRLCHFAAAALRLLLCKAVRQSYRDIRRMLSGRAQ